MVETSYVLMMTIFIWEIGTTPKGCC